MPSSLSKSRRNTRRRNENPPQNQPRLDAPISILSAGVAGTVLTLTFDMAVSLKDATVPEITTDVAGAVPVSAAQTAPNIVAITFDQDISLATALNIPYHDPAIRNARGGFVVTTEFTI